MKAFEKLNEELQRAPALGLPGVLELGTERQEMASEALAHIIGP